MRQCRQVPLICAGLLLIGAFFVFAVPRVFHYLVERSVYDVSALESVGKYKDDGYYYSNMFANDSTYGKFIYAKAGFENNPYFKPVTQSDMDWVRVYIEHFSKCVDTFVGLDDRECADLVEHYDFDPACITAGDYVYFKEPVPDYDVDEDGLFRFCFYFFDTESSTMYYFSNRMGYRLVEDIIGKYKCVTSRYVYSIRGKYTHYAKYVYSVVRFEDNGYFKQVTPSNIAMLRDYTDWYTETAKSYENSRDREKREFFEAYDFDPGCITEDDYFFVRGRDDFYIFDMESSTMYRFQVRT